MRDFSNNYAVDGTAAIDRSTCANSPYRRSEALNNVVVFPGLRSSSLPNPHLHVRENTNRYEFEEMDARERLNARMRRSAEAKKSKMGVRAYSNYFTGIVEMMAENMHEGSIAGSCGPTSSRVTCVVGTSAISALCFAVALL